MWRSIVRTTRWLVPAVLSLAFLAGCSGQIGDAVSSIASGHAHREAIGVGGGGTHGRTPFE